MIPSSFSKACSAVALTAWLSFFLSAAAATAVAPSTAMLGALPREPLEEPRAPRRELELGAELRGPVAVTGIYWHLMSCELPKLATFGTQLNCTKTLVNLVKAVALEFGSQ